MLIAKAVENPNGRGVAGSGSSPMSHSPALFVDLCD
jgi:hypothetical protein